MHPIPFSLPEKKKTEYNTDTYDKIMTCVPHRCQEVDYLRAPIKHIFKNKNVYIGRFKPISLLICLSTPQTYL